jgi:predicted enzyme related to lactoylglutathione lyase
VDHAVGRLAQVHVSVTDLDRSVRFYRDVLGLRHLFTVDGQPMAFFDAGGVRLYLGVPEIPELASHALLYYAVDDLAATYAAVVSRGAAPHAGPQLVHRDGGTELWMAFVLDPDGTLVGLMAEQSAGEDTAATS